MIIALHPLCHPIQTKSNKHESTTSCKDISIYIFPFFFDWHLYIYKFKPAQTAKSGKWATLV